jgi:hypothetical protein
MSEEVVSCQFDRLFWRDQQNIDCRASIHAEESLGGLCLSEAVKPAEEIL